MFIRLGNVVHYLLLYFILMVCFLWNLSYGSELIILLTILSALWRDFHSTSVIFILFALFGLNRYFDVTVLKNPTEAFEEKGILLKIQLIDHKLYEEHF